MREPSSLPRPVLPPIAWIFLSAAVLLFVALTFFRQVEPSWARVALPPVLWLATALLVASSFTLEAARLARRTSVFLWLLATGTLGLLFLTSEAVGWGQLAVAGVLGPATPGGPSFYLLAGIHALMLLSALGFLAGTAVRTALALSRGRYAPARGTLVACAACWHCTAALWVYLVLRLAAG